MGDQQHENDENHFSPNDLIGGTNDQFLFNAQKAENFYSEEPEQAKTKVTN